jgi:hypothetical protein
MLIFEPLNEAEKIVVDFIKSKRFYDSVRVKNVLDYAVHYISVANKDLDLVIDYWRFMEIPYQQLYSDILELYNYKKDIESYIYNIRDYWSDYVKFNRPITAVDTIKLKDDLEFILDEIRFFRDMVYDAFEKHKLLDLLKKIRRRY